MQGVTRWSLLLSVAGIAAGCGDQAGVPLDPQRATPVIERYAELVYANYSDALAKANAFKAAVDAFAITQTPEAFTQAREAWKAAHVPYGQSEAYRFYEGPIDNETDGPEGRLNSWPLEEAYIDYVEGSPTAGIINDPATYPEITEALLIDRNGRDAETHISTGFHAIEFLLWGQDRSAAGPGDRPYTDFVDDGTAQNQARRRQYLSVVTQLLVDDLASVQVQWAPNAVNYRKTFVALAPKDAVQKILTGMASLSGAELSGRRMKVAWESKSQEGEYSCFSDNTLVDLKANAASVQNVYLGRYGATDGAGLDELVQAIDPSLNDLLTEQLTASATAIDEIPPPFDQAVQGDDSSVGRIKIKAAIDALEAETQSIGIGVATALGVQLNLE